MEKLLVNKGYHDFKPNIHPFFLRKKKSRCNFRFALLPSMWYDINDPQYPKNKRGEPYKGWNKLGFGFTQGIFSNSRRSVMVAEFPFKIEGFHDIAFYMNDRRGWWDVKYMIVAESEKIYRGFIQWFRHEAVMFIEQEDQQSIYAEDSFKIRRSNWLPLRGLGAWHGGQYPAMQRRVFMAEQEYI